MDIRTSNLDDPGYSDFAWGRYKALMWWMSCASALSVVVSLGVLRWIIGPIPLPMLIATAGGIFFSVLLAAALMGLVFLSSGSGHDETINDPLDGEEDPR
jgi:hypothetical protein